MYRKIIINKLTVFINAVKKVVNIPLFRIILQLIILFFSFLYIWKNFEKILYTILDIDFKYGLLSLSIIFGFLGVIIGGAAWWLLLKKIDSGISLFSSMNIHFTSNIAKYLPGFGWQIFGKFFLTNEVLKNAKLVTKLIIIEMILIFFSGFQLFSLLLILDRSISYLPHQFSFVWIKPTIISINIILIFLSIYLMKHIKNLQLLLSFNSYKIVLIYFLIFIGWIANGLSFHFACLAIGINLNLYNSIFIMSTAFLFGFLFFFVPGSFGVREGAIVFLLQSSLSQEKALTIVDL